MTDLTRIRDYITARKLAIDSGPTGDRGVDGAAEVVSAELGRIAAWDAEVPANEWRPIETAPKSSDGENVILFKEETDDWCIGFWGLACGRTGWHTLDSNVPHTANWFSHWHPIPAPPKASPTPADDTPAAAMAHIPDETLAEIEARAKKATPGPWAADEHPPVDGYLRITGGFDGDAYDDGSTRLISTHICDVIDGEDEFANAFFIAHSREDIPKLIAALRASNAMVDALEAALRVQRGMR